MTRLIEFLQESASLGLWSLGAVILVPAIVLFLILHLLVRQLEGEGEGEGEETSMRRFLRHYARVLTGAILLYVAYVMVWAGGYLLQLFVG